MIPNNSKKGEKRIRKEGKERRKREREKRKIIKKKLLVQISFMRENRYLLFYLYIYFLSKCA